MLEVKKTCSTCGESKMLSDFYKHPGHGDGHANECKECAKERAHLNRINSLGSKKIRKPNSGRPSEQHVIEKLRRMGIYAVSGSATQYSWVDIVVWGCVLIEVKTSYFDGYQFHFNFTPVQLKRGVQADFILLVCVIPQDDVRTYHLFSANHPVFYRVGKHKRSMSYAPGAKPKPRGDIKVSLIDALMKEYENAWHLIEERRVEIQKALREGTFSYI